MSGLQAFLQARDFLLENRTNYQAAYAGFRWPVLDEFNWALDYFDTMAQGNDKLALWVVDEDDREQKLSFAEMSMRSNQVANFLRSKGVARGDRILLMLGNEVPLWEIMLAAMKLGAVMVPATVLLAREDLRDRIERGNIRHIVTSVEHTDKFDNMASDGVRICVGGDRARWQKYDAFACSTHFSADGITHATDPLLLYFTSGTTSKPKLVLHTHQSYPVGHLTTMYWIGLQPGDIHLNISSPGWAKHAWSCFFSPWIVGACIFIYNYERFDAKTMLNALVKHQVTTMCAPPTVWRIMIRENLADYAPRLKIRELVSAGEPLNPEIIEQLQDSLGITIRDGFGQTETTAQIANPPGQRLKPGSMGRPLPGYAIALLDSEGNEADEGEVVLRLDPRPVALMQVYIDSAEKTDEVMRDGYYRTGDVASRDEEGYITYVGRADDVFKAAGYRISPFELESVLIEHPAVVEAAVVPSPDPIRLSVPKAFIILGAGYEPSKDLAKELFVFLQDNLAPYKRIRRLEFADLPKTISGKIRRVQLREQEKDRVDSRVKGQWEFYEDDFPELKA